MVAPLNATVKSTSANSYLTVGRATTILRRRLYTTVWDNASALPSAANYTVTTGATAGSTSVPVTAGTGTFTVGTVISFAGHDQEYTVQANLSASGSLSISPGLVQAVTGGTSVQRLTANDREKALMWATQLLDAQMTWFGYKSTLTQSLWFPASGIIDQNGQAVDFDTIPALLEVATAELAQYLLTKDVFKVPDALGLGVSKVELGPLKATIDSGQQQTVIPANILSLLSDLGRLEPEAMKGSSIVQLKRV